MYASTFVHADCESGRVLQQQHLEGKTKCACDPDNPMRGLNNIHLRRETGHLEWFCMVIPSLKRSCPSTRWVVGRGCRGDGEGSKRHASRSARGKFVDALS